MRIEPSNRLISTHRNDQIGQPTVNRPVQTTNHYRSHEVDRGSQLGSAMLVTLFMTLVIGMISAATVANTLTRSKDSGDQVDGHLGGQGCGCD